MKANGISSEKTISPDDVTRTEISQSGKTKLVGSYKICLTAKGNIASVVQLKSTGSPAYDQKSISAIQRGWHYRPFRIKGKPTPACTVVTFIYSQRPVLPPPRSAPPTSPPAPHS